MILVVGDVITDIIVRPSGPLARGTDCPAAIDTRPGGSGANIACWMGHLGAPVAFAGRVGLADVAAQRATLAAQGVVAHLATDPVRPTGRIVAILDPDGERSFYTDRGANAALAAADLPDSLLDGVARLHVSGHTLYQPGPRAAAMALMRAARTRGCPVSVDVGSVAFLAIAGRAAFLGWTRDAALCFANAAEAAVLAAGAEDFAHRVITRGAEGVEAWCDGDYTTAPARHAAQPETTGAGDAAVAGYLVALAAGDGMAECLAASMTAAHRAVHTLGARPPLPRYPG